MTHVQTELYDTVMVYLHSLQCNWDDYGYSKVAEVAEDYALSETHFSTDNIISKYGNSLKGVVIF